MLPLFLILAPGLLAAVLYRNLAQKPMRCFDFVVYAVIFAFFTASFSFGVVYLRGFDVRQVPLFIDGIPAYVPYDGYVDFGRFTTFDLAEIRVAKADASLLYGPNTLGGAINLVTRKPVKPFEGDARLGFGSGQTRKAAVNLGGNQGLWYYQLGASYLDADSFPLPGGFKDYKAKPTDTGDNRQNAYRTDKRLSFKLGLTPNATDEYALGYVRQEGEKGNPVYTGRASGGIRYWRWPWWDKESLYFIGNIGLGESSGLKLRAYEDHYGNGLEAYADGTYATQLLNTSFPSVYSDKTRGVSVELSTQAIANHDLHLALHYKDDRHQDTNPKSPTKDYRDVTTSLALEDTITLGGDYTLRLGASHCCAHCNWPSRRARSAAGTAGACRRRCNCAFRRS